MSVPDDAGIVARENKTPLTDFPLCSASVDLQLPQVEESASAPSETLPLPPEPKHKFKERVITSLGGDEGGVATFRKSRTQNGKSRSLRQRDDAD